MERSIIKINNIWVEDLFKWFYEHVCDSGGDGAGVIVCENCKEVAGDFWQYCRSRKENTRIVRAIKNVG